jgi:hypothetical protein
MRQRTRMAKVIWTLSHQGWRLKPLFCETDSLAQQLVQGDQLATYVVEADPYQSIGGCGQKLGLVKQQSQVFCGVLRG